MAKYSVPSIKFTEIDNTVRSNSVPGLGIGAIVLKSNKGPVNQRILTSSYDYFTQIYGEPENLDDFGHFAAENYLAISNQLLCVRATMGDEGYAQIQYPYTDADTLDKIVSKDTAEFKYINNEDESQLKLLGQLSAVTTVSALVGDSTSAKEWLPDDLTGNPLSSFALKQKAQFATINDLITDAPPSVAVFKAITDSNNEIITAGSIKDSGKYIEFATKVTSEGKVTKIFDDLILTDEAWASGELPKDAFSINKTPITNIYADPDNTSATLTAKGYKTIFSIPSSATLNGSNYSLTAYFDADSNLWNNVITNSARETVKFNEIFVKDSFYAGGSQDKDAYCTEPPKDAVKIQFRDWDDVTNKTHYVLKNEFDASVGQTVGIQFREYGFNTKQEALAIVVDEMNDNNVKVTPLDELMLTDKQKVIELADEYGVDVAEIATKEFALLQYYDVWNGKPLDENGNFDQQTYDENLVEKVIYTEEWKEFKSANTTPYNEYLFWTIAEKNGTKALTISTFVQDNPSQVVIPWQDGVQEINDNGEVVKEPIRKMVALASSEVLNSTNETYRDGYTLSIESDDEPGNGDIEQYVSNKNNQLIIASIGPGEYGNDVGISIITAEAAEIPALNHQNAFNWKYKYDDEEQVDNDVDDLTWKKVYRVNVYVKSKTQTAEAAWGTGMDALLKDPIESFYVSNDPQAKNAEGNSLFAPNVINGHSEYIYVSRNSVNEAKTGAGTYAQPCPTYAIYQLTGGTNSKKNNITEKTAALKLYRDRQKADFDILFNVEAVETFNGRQRYGALQRKIAEIAAARKIDIGVVQVTSKESKSVKKMVGEAKMFSFNNGTYVAPYGGYDKYYNGTLGSWIYLPKSVAGACAMAYCDMFSYPWMAPAGVARGKIQYTTGQLSRLTDDEIGQLYDNNVNTSRQCGGFGEVLWGQKTALKKESALNRINVRRCLNYIEKQLENMLVPYLFQQNTPNTRSAAKNSIDAFLSRVQAAEGLIEYSLSVTQDSEDPHIMNVNIRLVPAEAIEFIDVKITIDRNTGVTAEEV
jgi:phage tail sheath protein FI